MKLNIGDNIKRLRRNRGMTQEQLAGLMNVSCAAVSKWESSDSYPDITLVMPLAAAFNVTVDELMGYDQARTAAEIDEILKQFRQLHYEGHFAEASALISQAHRNYPNDYRLMNCYMWDIAGGSAENDPAVMNLHHDELLHICDCILDGCTDEEIHLEAMTMKAKLLHAAGETSAAVELLSKFPSWYQSSAQKTEQLFAKDTPEFREQVKKNMYELADFTANKIIKSIWYDDKAEQSVRVGRCEAVCDIFSQMCKRSDESVFVVFEHSALAELSSILTYRGGSIGDIIRVREKCLVSARNLTERGRADASLNSYLTASCESGDMLRFTTDWLQNSSQDVHLRLRENPEYKAMLDKYST